MTQLLTVLYDSRHGATILLTHVATPWCSRFSSENKTVSCTAAKSPTVDHLVSDSPLMFFLISSLQSTESFPSALSFLTFQIVRCWWDVCCWYDARCFFFDELVAHFSVTTLSHSVQRPPVSHNVRRGPIYPGRCPSKYYNFFHVSYSWSPG